MRDLSEIRVDIDRVDKSIKELYKERLELAQEVAEYKISKGMPVLDTKREQEKLETLTRDIENPAIRNGIMDLFRKLMFDSRRLQHGQINTIEKEPFGFKSIESIDTKNARVIFQGEPGAYSQEAASRFFGSVNKLTNVATWRQAIEMVRDGVGDYCVLPIENSTAGSVTEIYDLLGEYDLSIMGEQVITIDHMLLGIKGASVSDIKKVYSHPQALAQCDGFFRSHPEIQKVEMLNTAAAAKLVSETKDPSIAAIAGRLNSEIYSLDIVAESIQDEGNNSTRFVILSKDKCFLKDAGKISISFTLKHEKGSLYNALSYLSYNDINLSLIESRPIRKVNWEYRFFVDMEGNLRDKNIWDALTGLRDITGELKILGNYK